MARDLLSDLWRSGEGVLSIQQGPQVAGWLDRYEPRWAEGLEMYFR
ncbi:MAG: hypothetical protein QOJ16_851 [Acidobacteriota bacterium]|jgi:hypothetical protein|nr:hypothetical protein [Acidobacteriota bacterium]